MAESVMADSIEATCTAPVNIAVIKYWGKRDTKLILPTNSSLSVTLSQDDLHSKTTVRAASALSSDRLWLNGVEEDVASNKRLLACLGEVRELRRKLEERAKNEGKALRSLSEWHVHIASENNFPTAAGLASSASGFACLVKTLSEVFLADLQPNLTSTSDLSRIARQGSGSACRSLFGGFVAWEEGQLKDGSDSLAVQVASEAHWPEMSAVILVVSDKKKTTSSTNGMQDTVQTSSLLQHRIKHDVPRRMQEMSEAILKKDFNAFAKITMADSNSFHAVCLDTSPPIFYMNDTSRAIVNVVEELNRSSLSQRGSYDAAYTFDAGPNAVLYVLQENVERVLSILAHFFADLGHATDPLPHGFNARNLAKIPNGSISRVIRTRVGDGPRRLDDASSLLSAHNLPKRAGAT